MTGCLHGDLPYKRCASLHTPACSQQPPSWPVAACQCNLLEPSIWQGACVASGPNLSADPELPTAARRFTYQLLQGFDFVHMARHHGVRVQVCARWHGAGRQAVSAESGGGLMTAGALGSAVVQHDFATLWRPSRSRHGVCTRCAVGAIRWQRSQLLKLRRRASPSQGTAKRMRDATDLCPG